MVDGLSPIAPFEAVLSKNEIVGLTAGHVPPYLLRHLKKVARLMPCVRRRSLTATPASASLQDANNLGLTEL